MKNFIIIKFNMISISISFNVVLQIICNSIANHNLKNILNERLCAYLYAILFLNMISKFHFVTRDGSCI